LHRACRHGGDERGYDMSIKRIASRQNAARLGKLLQLTRIDLSHRYACSDHRMRDCLTPNCSDREAPQSLDKCHSAGRVIRHLLRHRRVVKTMLRYLNSTERQHLCISFLRVRDHATVRGWKMRSGLQAHSRNRLQGTCGLRVAAGRRS
jgi:hypothetical protein